MTHDRLIHYNWYKESGQRAMRLSDLAVGKWLERTGQDQSSTGMVKRSFARKWSYHVTRSHNNWSKSSIAWWDQQ